MRQKRKRRKGGKKVRLSYNLKNAKEKRSKRVLDDIPMEHLINYILKNFADEAWEALAEDRHG